MAEPDVLSYESSRPVPPRRAPNWSRSYVLLLLDALTVLSLIVCIVTLPLWVLSYSRPDLPSDLVSGFSPVPPPHPLTLPMPSDAEEYLVPLRGRLERWEYAPWERKWYRLSRGSSMNAVVAPLLAIPLARLIFGRLLRKNSADEAAASA